MFISAYGQLSPMYTLEVVLYMCLPVHREVLYQHMILSPMYTLEVVLYMRLPLHREVLYRYMVLSPMYTLEVVLYICLPVHKEVLYRHMVLNPMYTLEVVLYMLHTCRNYQDQTCTLWRIKSFYNWCKVITCLIKLV